MRLSVASILCALPAVLSASLGAVSKADLEYIAAGGVVAAAAAKSIDLSALPAWEPVPELNLTPIVPGPGLPTLEELGLTWADLTKPLPEPEAETGALAKRYTPRCHGESYTFEYADGLWCYNYLNGLGATSCTVPATGTIQMCWAPNSGSWAGYSATGVSETATCAEVAAGGQWVLDNCKVRTIIGWAGWNEKGSNAAWDHANLIVNVGWN